MTSPATSWERTFKGRVHSQELPRPLLGDPRALELHFTGFLQRSREWTFRVRAVLSVGLVLGLAFVAGRAGSPVAVGLCGLLVVAPLVWLGTAVLVPVLMMGRGEHRFSGALAMQTGTPIERLSAGGVLAGELRVGWGSITSSQLHGEDIVLRGVDLEAHQVFEIVLTGGNFSSGVERETVLAAIDARRAGPAGA